MITRQITFEKLDKRLRELADNCTPTRQRHILTRVGEDIEGGILRRFEATTAPEIAPGGRRAQRAQGKTWKPLAASTVERKRRAGRTQMLVWSGAMRDNIGHKITVTPKVCRLEVGTTAYSEKGAPYPVYIQAGTSKMPARPFIGVDRADVKAVVDLILRELAR